MLLRVLETDQIYSSKSQRISPNKKENQFADVLCALKKRNKLNQAIIKKYRKHYAKMQEKATISTEPVQPISQKDNIFLEIPSFQNRAASLEMEEIKSFQYDDDGNTFNEVKKHVIFDSPKNSSAVDPRFSIPKLNKNSSTKISKSKKSTDEITTCEQVNINSIKSSSEENGQHYKKTEMTDQSKEKQIYKFKISKRKLQYNANKTSALKKMNYCCRYREKSIRNVNSKFQRIVNDGSQSDYMIKLLEEDRNKDFRPRKNTFPDVSKYHIQRRKDCLQILMEGNKTQFFQECRLINILQSETVGVFVGEKVSVNKKQMLWRGNSLSIRKQILIGKS